VPGNFLLDQLDLMDRRLADVADDIARHDSDKLLANGRFLAEKFGVSGVDLGPDAGATAGSLMSASAAPVTVASEEVAARDTVAEGKRVP
jgi:hypothetical protein